MSQGRGGLSTALALGAAILALSWAALRFYDEPLRAWLALRPRERATLVVSSATAPP